MDRPPLSYIPLLPVLTGLIAGILCCRYLDFGVTLTVAVLLIIAVILLIIKQKVALEFILATLLGFVVTSVSLPVQFTHLPGSDTRVTGLVTEVVYSPDYQQFKVESEDKSEKYTILVTYAVFEPAIKAGDIVTLTGSYSLPYIDTDLPLESDMAEYYYINGISLRCYVPKGHLYVTGHDGNLLTIGRNWRSKVVDKICSSKLNEATSAFLAAILVGDDSLVSDDLRSDYATAGVAHLLALSGAHVAIITVVIAFILFPIAAAGHRRTRWWITLFILWGYAILTGLSPSVCRAVIMASAVLLALIFDRPRSSLNSLCLAAVLILLFSPLSLFKTGFQLSFMATLSIILISNRLTPSDSMRKGDFRFWNLITVTFAATLGTLPIVICRYHTVPVYFLIANIVAVFVIPVIIGAGVIFVLLLLAGHEPDWIVWLLDNLYALFNAIVTWVASLPSASITGIYVNAWLAVPMYLTLAFFVAFIYLRKKVYLTLMAATFLFSIATAITLRPEYADNEAYMIRSNKKTTIAVHNVDTLNIYTASPEYNFLADSLSYSNRYRDYLASRGIGIIEMHELDDKICEKNGVIPFGEKYMLIAHLIPSNSSQSNEKQEGSGVVASGDVSMCSAVNKHADYCLITAKWYGDPVALYKSVDADTIVLSNDINRRRRQRYFSELTAANIPVIDLSEQPLMSY